MVSSVTLEPEVGRGALPTPDRVAEGLEAATRPTPMAMAIRGRMQWQEWHCS